MKRNAKTQIVNMSEKDIMSAVSDAEKKIAQLRLDRFTKQQKNVREVRTLRQKIAVLKTVMVGKAQEPQVKE